jgi:hypothetical protein
LAFDRFEQLVGQGAGDDFRVDFSAGDAATSRLLVRGGGGTDVLRAVGGANVDRADTLTVLSRIRNWPTQTGASAVFAGFGFNSGPPVLYDDFVETLDLQGGAGDDTFKVDPGPKPARGEKAIPLYGTGVRTLLLEGQLGADTFAVVPDKFTPGSNADPKVTIYVFGGSGDPATGGSPAAVDEQDRMTLYRLPAKYKANFPVEGRGGLRTQVFDLKSLNFAPVRYYDMWTVKAEIMAPPA